MVCVGPIRSGTTWIYELLKNHPQCITTDPKETSFFCINYDKGFDWFLSRFQKSTEQTKICADLSPSYFIHHRDLKRIKQYASEIKIIICLRNPYDRLRSIHNKQNATGEKRELLDYIENTDLREQDALGYNIICDKAQFFFEQFGRENVYFFYFDELKTNPEKAATDLLDFLQLEHHLPPSVDQVVNPTYEPRSELLEYLARKVSAMLRKLKLHSLVDFVKFTFGKRLLYGSHPSKPSLNEKDMRALLDYFRDDFNADINRLEEMTGRNLGHWKRG